MSLQKLYPNLEPFPLIRDRTRYYLPTHLPSLRIQVKLFRPPPKVNTRLQRPSAAQEALSDIDNNGTNAKLRLFLGLEIRHNRCRA